MLKKKIISFASVLIIIIILTAFAIVKIKNKQFLNQNTEIIPDTTAPIIVLGDSYTVKTGYSKNLLDVIMSADDVDQNPKREIIGEYDLNNAGEYNLTYKIEDSAGNVTTKDFVLKVKDNYKYTESEISFQDAVKKYKNDATKLGIDVSKWQQDIDWQKVAEDGVEFAILRMGYQNGFDGEISIDPYFEKNVKGCMENNIPISVYLSSYAKTATEAKSQADWICGKLKEYNYSNVNISFDWENWNSFNKLGLSLNDINNIADTFMDECVNQGYNAMLYGSKTYLEAVWKNEKNYPVWLANYVDETSYSGKYRVWQFSQTGIVSGVKGKVDINVMYESFS